MWTYDFITEKDGKLDIINGMGNDKDSAYNNALQKLDSNSRILNTNKINILGEEIIFCKCIKNTTVEDIELGESYQFYKEKDDFVVIYYTKPIPFSEKEFNKKELLTCNECYFNEHFKKLD